MGRRTWIKIYCDKWLRGSIREESPETRAIWIDILSLAGDSAYGDDGIISVAPGCGYTDEQIAKILRVPIQLWKKTKKKLQKTDRISNNKSGEIVITNWKSYQSEYARQKQYRQSDNTKSQGKVTPKSNREKREERREKREKEIEKERTIIMSQINNLLPQFLPEIQELVTEYVELARIENKTQRITLCKKKRLIAELFHEWSNCDSDLLRDDFKAALRTSISNEAPHINYVKKVMKGNIRRRKIRLRRGAERDAHN